MKKRSTIALLMFSMMTALALGAPAGAPGLGDKQAPAWSGRVLLSAGANLPRLHYSDNFGDFGQKDRPALLVSLALLLRLSERFWFSPGARLEKRDAAVSVAAEEGGMSAVHRTTVLAFPLALVFKPFAGDSSPFIQAGVEGNWLLRNRLVPDDEADPFQDLLADSRKTYLAPFVGAGYIMELEHGSLVFQACCSLMGAKFYREQGDGEEYSLRSSSFFVSIGYAIRTF